MKLSNFDYHLPENLIAQTPLEKRDSSKLFFYDKKNNSKQHKNFSEIIDLVDENSVLVFNKSRVIPARIKFKWENWWNREIFLSRKISKPGEKNIWECIVAPWAKFKEWRKYFLWWMKIFVEKVYPEKISWVREISFEPVCHSLAWPGDPGYKKWNRFPPSREWQKVWRNFYRKKEKIQKIFLNFVKIFYFSNSIFSFKICFILITSLCSSII